jgi:hypothetical protein
MAHYKVLEKSFIGLKLYEAGEVVEINDNPDKGGMTPGDNLAKCDSDGNLAAAQGAKVKGNGARAPAPDLG